MSRLFVFALASILSLQGMAQSHFFPGPANPSRPHLFTDGPSGRHHERWDLNQPNIQTVPFWSDTFDYHRLTFSYRMVGSDPKKGSITTVIPTVLIPIRWVFSNGLVVDASTDLIDGRTAVQGISDSPLFKDFNFESGGTNVGYTQYGDAFQRANFWNSVATRSPNYHVTLGGPTRLPTQTIQVPDSKVNFYFDPSSGLTIPLIDIRFLEQVQSNSFAALNISPKSLPIVVWGAIEAQSSFDATQPGAGGWHGATKTNNAIQTWIATSYFPQNAHYGNAPDVYPLSHEILEWLNDPFTDNYTAGWIYPFLTPVDVCDSTTPGLRDLLEVGDPIEIFQSDAFVTITAPGFSYHLTEGMFVDYFTRQEHSRSVNGQYSFFEIGRPYGLETGPSLPCTCHIEITKSFFSIPGATSVSARGLNNHGQHVGYFFDTSGRVHGFVRDQKTFSIVDFPGAVLTALQDINDTGVIVGIFESSDNVPHGFMLKNGKFTNIDFPGAIDTVPERINASGDVVGQYDSTQPVTHGFVLSQGGYQTVDTPFGLQSDVAGINDQGVIVGTAWTDPINGPTSGFLKTREGYSSFNFPGSSLTFLTGINNFGDLAGYFINSGGYLDAMVTLFGYPYLNDYAYLFDINEMQQVLGNGYNSASGTYQPFIGTFPPLDGR